MDGQTQNRVTKFYNINTAKDCISQSNNMSYLVIIKFTTAIIYKSKPLQQFMSSQRTL